MPPVLRNDIRLAYSVDADDAFMFHALAAGHVDARGHRFVHTRADTADLNALAKAGGADVIAVSLGVVPAIVDDYLLLPHGASVGRGYGPVVVAKTAMQLRDLRGKRIGIPGHDTTAWLVLRLMQEGLIPVLVPIAPFSRVWDALETGEIDAALVIHEGRLLYQERGYALIAELGQWWLQETGLPLPLGVNVIRRALGAAVVADVSAVLSDAIAWALGHREDVMAHIAREARGDAALARVALLDRYLGMYANADTASIAPDVREAIDVLFARARAAGLLDGGAGRAPDWAP